MIPEDALKKMRSVDIHYNCGDFFIRGFSFFDKDGALLWKIGNTTDADDEFEKVELEEYEVIVGVRAGLYEIY